ncbi:hypothetical protein KSF_112150 [Reticulibacter mediterranei]|uniref:NADH-quinone oxidoreductase subunit J n=1 Tax=Reticulibacter mediterranei TaxID=2778369 RepID=A0A8J3N778_9CHLR|nr:NADH-quinone oxidoreductase subunit J [Reticulibacter mediterranei]GHP01168.1 hypothetical protein KSF_112150 [Reticulibacter mediterranei]
MSGMIEWIIFLLLALVAIGTAAGMLLTMSMYRAGLALMASFVALAGLFILLDADLLAAIQVMMNVGGMLVMVLFMVMIMMDPGGEMMWSMKRDMHMPGPGAFSMHMPSASPPPEEETTHQEHDQSGDWTCPMHPEISQPGPGKCPKCGMGLIARTETEDEYGTKQRDQQDTAYSCPMHPEVQQDHLGNCPKCGMTLVAQKQTGPLEKHAAMAMDHALHEDDMAQSEHNADEMPAMTQETDAKENSRHDMSMAGMRTGGHEMEHMHGSGMTPRQNYDMMVDMAMSTAQLPWAIGIGTLSALLLIALLILTPWPVVNAVPTQDASHMVGQLLLSRYMIAFEGAALLILAGIVGAVVLAKREHSSARPSQASQPEQSLFTCPMHADIQLSEPGMCPRCGMDLVPSQETGEKDKQKGDPV